MSYSLLLVDDSPLIRKMVKRTLSLAKLDVGCCYEASNGREALELLQKEWVDLVFADIHMPVMNGMELIETMAKDEVLSKIPVVVLTAERSEPALARLRGLGIHRHIPKPFTPEVVLRTVQAVLAQAGGGYTHGA
jgi:two-component system chemotaxis response regulator CheY